MASWLTRGRTASGRFSAVAGEALTQLDHCARETAELRTVLRACRRPLRLLLVGGLDWTASVAAGVADLAARVQIDRAKDLPAATAAQYDLVAVQPGSVRAPNESSARGLVTGDASAVCHAVRTILGA